MLHTSKSSCGGLIKDSLGQFCGGFAANLGVCLITIAELWGIFYALHLAWEKGFHHFPLEADSSNGISLIQKDSIDRHPFASVIKRVRSFLCCDWEVWLLHIYCEANSSVDFLTAYGHFVHLGVCFFESAPNSLGPLLWDDIAGVSFTRIVS